MPKASPRTALSKIQVRAPATIYVLFHQESGEARALAQSVYRWFRLREQDDDGIAVGVPLFFRTLLDTIDTGKGRRVVPSSGLRALKPEIERDAQHVFVVPLVCDLMVADPAWRSALREIEQVWVGDRDGSGPITSRLSILPVMVDRSFDNLGSFGEAFNPVRIWDAKDIKPEAKPKLSPIPKGADPLAVSDREAAHEAATKAWKARRKAWIAVRARRLRRGLTEQIIRDLDEKSAESWKKRLRGSFSAPRLKVFISHAKADGEGLALQLRDSLATVGKLEPWFDKNDLVAGRRAAEPMVAAARGSNGGLIAVVTDAYPTRSWCWKEAEVARTPKLERPSRRFTVAPTVAVSMPGPKWSRTPPALARVSRIGWEADSEGKPVENMDAMGDVVDRLLLELLTSRVSRAIQDQLSKKVDKRTWFLDFVPDAHSLALVARSIPRRSDFGPRTAATLIYPGHGLRALERVALEEAAQGLHPRLLLVPLERLQFGPAAWEGARPGAVGSALRIRAGSLVAVSAGGSEADLAHEGLSGAHLDEFTVRLTRALLDSGLRVAYGGSLQPHRVSHNLTRAILDAARGWADGHAVGGGPRSEAGADPEDTSPVINYVAKTHATPIDAAMRAEFLGLCTFEVVGVEPAPGWLAAKSSADRREKGMAVAELSRMRERMATDTAARVLFGGKIHGWSGLLPGIAEELLACMDAAVPCLIVRGLGGCGKVVADFLCDGGTYPKALTHAGEVAGRQPLREKDGDIGLSWDAVPRAKRTAAHRRLKDALTALAAPASGSALSSASGPASGRVSGSAPSPGRPGDHAPGATVWDFGRAVRVLECRSNTGTLAEILGWLGELKGAGTA